MKQSEERIVSALAAWGDFRVVSPLTDGHRNYALLVELEGTLAVAKSTRRSAKAVAWLEPVLDAAERSGFRVPRYLAAVDGRSLVDGVTVETFLPGSPPAASELEWLLPSIRDFHRATLGFRQRPGFSSSLDLLRLDRGGDVDLGRMPEPLVQACREAWQRLHEGDHSMLQQSVVHGDLNRDNLLLDGDGAPGLIDWDEARVDLPLFDELSLQPFSSTRDLAAEPLVRALLAWEVAASWQLEPGHARRLAKRLLQSREWVKGAGREP